MLIQAPQMEIGEVFVTTTTDKGHDPEFWAKVASDRIISVGGGMPPRNCTTGRSVQAICTNNGKFLYKRSN